MRNDKYYRAVRALEGRPVVDKRKREYRKDTRTNRDRTFLTNFQRRKIVAWDGEGANLPSGEHIYNLLANSYGKFIVNHEGLSTEECFQFMLQFHDPKAINVIYGGSYDVNMILRDVPPEKLKQLWATGTCYWGKYSIHYAHRKKFSVKEYRRDLGHKPVRWIVIWDVLGFFQTSFVKACRKWIGEELAGEELTIFRNIEDMKIQRSQFTVGKIEDILKYNYMECQFLILLMGALFSALDEANIQLRRYDGAGAIAAALFRQHNIIEHKGELPQEVLDWAQYAYGGGRIEAPLVGNAPNQNIYRYDINSAYPSAAIELPSYTGSEWKQEAVWNGSPFSLVDVEWAIRKKMPFYPLWYRLPNGSILYPREGRGRYYGFEIQLLFDFFEEGKDFRIVQAYNVTFATDAKPFQFLRQVYAVRRMFKDQGSMAHEALKLGMNSVYGKLAQQAGYRNGRIPTYHHLVWAGQITSSTRATLYRAAMQHPNDIVAFATDAIISKKEHNLPIGSGLGEWSPEHFLGITLVQPGVYWLRYSPEEWTDKYRGFDAGSLVRDDIVKAWENNTPYKAHLTRFYGMGSAIAMNNFEDYWRCWRTEERELNIYPNGKRMATKDCSYAERLCRTDPMLNPYGQDALSTPHPLAWGLGSGQTLRPTNAEGLDIRLVEEEMMDSYA